MSSGDATEATAARAERLFADLTDQAERQRNANRRAPDPEAGAVPARIVDPSRSEPRSPAGDDVSALVRSTLAACDRIAEVVQVVGLQVEATSTDLAAMGRAIEQALEATNARLAALERVVLGEAAPGAQPTERALIRLRRTIPRPARGTDSGSAR